MTEAARHARVRAVFSEAAKLSEPNRDAYLRETAAGDPELLREVRELLQHHDRASDSGQRLGELEAAFVDGQAPNATRAEIEPTTLAPGYRLGVFEIVSMLGQGGMGEVYRAHDRSLDRQVAIKVLPKQFAGRPDRLSRFEREAKVLAQLSHANVATLHGLETAEVVTADGDPVGEGRIHFLAMELVEGETLQEWYRRGPMPWRELVPLFEQIAAGLKAAHERGIVHRDLKPANVIVDPEETVKVLDFGLARFERSEALAQLEGGDPDTHAGTLTKSGVVMGTFGYMAPEQARGEEADRRADIWAFGCCLYQGLTGVSPFAADGAVASLAAILKTEPDWSQVPADVPEPLLELMSLCLVKKRRQRLQDFGDAHWFLTRALDPTRGLPYQGSPAKSRFGPVAIAVLAAVALLLGVLLGRGLDRVGSDPPTPVRFSEIANPPPLNSPTGRSFAVAPDGRSFFYVALGEDGESIIVQRDLARGESTPVAGTDGASDPFVSDDSQWLGFYRQGALYRVPAGGGSSLLLGEVPDTGIVGASWVGDRIVVGINRRGLWWISNAGAAPEPLSSSQDQVTSEIERGWYPTLLSDDRVLFDVAGFTGAGTLVVLDLGTGELTRLGAIGMATQYVDNSHLVWAFGDGLWAARFDASKLELRGAPVRVVQLAAVRLGRVDFAVSRSGTLVAQDPGDLDLVQVTAAGQRSPLGVEPGVLRHPRWSPDGRWIAFTRGGVAAAQIWLLEVASGRIDRLVHDRVVAFPVWSDNDSLLYFDPPQLQELVPESVPGDGRSAPVRISQAPLDHRAEPAAIHDSPGLIFPLSLGSRGSILVRRRDDIWVVNPENNEERIWLQSDSTERNAVFSPDGRWVAYDSNATGEWQVYVRPFAGPGGARPASVSGGSEPAWSPNGRTLYYRRGTELRAVDVRFERDQLEIGKERIAIGFFPRPTFDGDRSYDPKPDGRGFVALDVTGGVQFRVVLNWGEELRRIVPGEG